MSEPAGPPMTLLFVDDDAPILSALRRLFRPHGYRVLTAGSGAEGLEILAHEEVDLVVSDMRMPNMDGAAFLKEVRLRRPQTMRLLLTGYADMSATIAAINQGEIYRYVSKPWNDDEVVQIVREALDRRRLERENERLNELTLRQNDELRQLNAGLEQRVAARTAEVRQTFALLQEAHKELKRSFMAAVRVFSGLIELRGGKLAGHSRRVAEHARALAQRVGLDDGAVQDVLLAALLHDIGKIGLSDEVLNRPFNGLPADVRGEVMKHPVTGQMVLLGVEQLRGAARLIRHHHENFDGSGYPDGLTGLAIPHGARVLSVANDYDALQMGLLANRVMRPAEALAFVLDNAGKRYDPEIAAAFAAMLAEARSEGEERSLRPDKARPGMVLARDLVHREGYLLLAKGQQLNDRVIQQLMRLESIENKPIMLFVRPE